MSTTFPMSIPHAPTGFVNQAALDTAFTTPINDLAAQFAAGSQGLLNETTAGANVTLSTTSLFASAAVYTFTLATQRRIRIEVGCDITLASGVAGRYGCQAGYNSGSSAVIGSFAGVGRERYTAGSIAGLLSAVTTSGTALLAAGTYTAYMAVRRFSGGTATDTAGNYSLAVYDEGAV